VITACCAVSWRLPGAATSFRFLNSLAAWGDAVPEAAAAAALGDVLGDGVGVPQMDCVMDSVFARLLAV
jgi:hypothetical protein